MAPIKKILFWIFLTFTASAGAQFNEIILSAIPSYHIPHSGLLGKFHPGLGFYLRGHTPENHFFFEGGLTRFYPKQKFYVNTTNSAYTNVVSYSSYTGIALNLGYLFEIKNKKNLDINTGFYGGYWYNYYDYFYQDRFRIETGVAGSAKLQLGGLISIDKSIDHFRYGIELRYGALLPIRLGETNSPYEGLIITGLRLGYYFY